MIAAEIIIFGCLIAGILIAIRVIAGPRNVMKSARTTDAPRVILLFKDGQLCDMTAEARSLLGDELTRLTTLDELLSDTFPNLSLSDLDRQSCEVFGLHAGSHLTAQVVGNRLRVEIVGLGQIVAARQTKSLGLLTQIERYAPQLIWQQNDQGRIIWSNASYQRLVDEVGADGPVVFPDLVAASEEAPQRRQPSGTKERWFDITMREENGLLTCFGVETTELVRADENRREYVKTLGRTFADLSTGLAIFDKDRQLKMFNPALLEMSKLPFTFFSTQPRIDTFFDRIIADCVLFENVNPDRVYLMGYSAGGDGVYQLAPRMADRFAAAAMMAGHPNETSPLGLRNLPFTLHMGGDDGAYNRNQVAADWKLKLEELQQADDCKRA